jgi:RNA polymerase sigma factor (sigma-70 family)
LIRRLPKLSLDPDRGNLHAWVAAVARHHAGRHARRRLRQHHEALTPELASVLLDPATGPVTELERKQRRTLVQAVITALGERMSHLRHQIIVRYWIEEQPLSVIAAELNMSEDSVWSAIRCARPKLRDRLRLVGLDADLEKN